MDGVEKVDVDFKTKTVTVTCASGCDQEKMVAALEEKGFGGSVNK